MEQKDALYQNGGPPAYELTAEHYAVPVHLREGGKTWKIFVRLKVSDFGAQKKLLGSIKETDVQKMGETFAERVTSGDDPIRGFVVSNFLELSGIVNKKGEPISKETQDSFIAKNRGGATTLIGIAATLNVSRPQRDIEAVEGPLVFEDEGDTQEVATEVTLANFEKQDEVVLPVVHVLRMESEADRQTYRKATKQRSRTENRQTISWVQTNYETVAKVYDSMVLSIDGATVDGKSCNESNKPAWLPKVPLSWKAFVLNSAFNRIESKNE